MATLKDKPDMGRIEAIVPVQHCRRWTPADVRPTHGGYSRTTALLNRRLAEPSRPRVNRKRVYRIRMGTISCSPSIRAPGVLGTTPPGTRPKFPEGIKECFPQGC
jgi:hypothetical protein